MINTSELKRASEWLRNADGIVIAAGAGMSVDSGLPDFRGTHGLWTSLLPAGMTERDVGSLTQGDCFLDRPVEAWQFYGRAFQVCRQLTPHRGYAMLARWARRVANGAFVFTSNVDGHFQAAGYDEARVLECHGTMNFMQCGKPCGAAIWPSDSTMANVDPDALTLSTLPRCPHCGHVARPNFLLFDDHHWVEKRTAAQWERMGTWLRAVKRPVVIELGAGTAVPSVRMFAESVRGPLIRINPEEYDVAGEGVGLQGTALDVLDALDALLATN
ncbi:SIR2 family NAD-dependent protein deacylase [Paraburkholderia caledonica]|jgi:NAD-dependent SIR2 family protein deacetylase|uniref:SIR2 family NAD-dependent protein deacylase n=1 Tax=Paraburkholderia caledonica TaxID=134536 RepID=UPI000485A403|nr:Sir2 family NAD-dependent protein deacetylase [Paraburkholderia caledonica]